MYESYAGITASAPRVGGSPRGGSPLARLIGKGWLFVMGDSAQQLCGWHAFDLSDVVHVRCMGNFRSPRRVVDVINQLKLTFTRAQFRLE